MSGEVQNWLPGEPGKYLTILDLKERWMKKQQEEEEKKKKKKEAEKVCERVNELTIFGEKDRVEAKRVGGSWWKYGVRGSGGRSGLKADGDVELREMPACSNSQIGGRRRGVGDGDLCRILETEKSECKKVDDAKVCGNDLVRNDKARFAGGGRYRSRKRFSRDGSCLKAMVSDVTENVGVDPEKSVEEQNQQIQEIGSVGDEKETRMNCPCHSRSENQCGGGFWVCKYVEPASGAEIGESVKGNDIMEGKVVDIAGKGNGGKVELKLLKKRGLARKVREDAMRVTGDFSRIVKYDDVLRKPWQQRQKWEMSTRVKCEVVAKQMPKVGVAVDKDSQRMSNRDGSCQNNGVKIQSLTVEPTVEIEEHIKASEATERETTSRGKFRDRGNPTGGRKINDTEKFKAERNSGSLTMDYVKKDVVHVSSSCKKAEDQFGTHHKNYDSTPKHEKMEPNDCAEKSEAAVGTVMVGNSSDKFRDMRNDICQREKFANRKGQLDRTVASERTNHPKIFNGKMREIKLGRGGFMWVKKGEASVDSAGCKY